MSSANTVNVITSASTIWLHTIALGLRTSLQVDSDQRLITAAECLKNDDEAANIIFIMYIQYI